MFDTGIADRLRAKASVWKAPLDVVEIDGWRERGGSFPRRPDLAVGHHTGNPNMAWAPSLRICINGRGGANPVPGPLCNVMRSRVRDGRFTAFVIAAGVANHAGRGGYQGRTGNSSCYGLEAENNGTTEAWTEQALDVDALILAAMLDGAGTVACEHKEWAPGRKPDRHHVDGDDTRSRVLKFLGPAPTPAPSPEDYDMDYFIVRKAGSDGRWAWWPESHRKTIIAADAIAEFAANKHYGGDLKLEASELDGIPNLAD